MTFLWWRRNKNGDAARKALRQAAASQSTARRDLSRQEAALIEAASIKRALQEHNAANGYDVWLSDVLR